MRKIEVYETFDKQRFDHIQQAERHIDSLYATKLSKLGHKLLAASSELSSFMQALNDNLPEFVEAYRVRESKKLEADFDDRL
jgi:hypothetical protein